MTLLTATPAVLGWALSYAARGMAVFPLRPRSKEPLTSHGFKDATIETAPITAWWTLNPSANIGIATGAVSNVAVLDVDGPDAERALQELASEVDHEDFTWQDTWIVKTGRPSGAHFYYRMTADVPRSGARRLGDGLDVKAEGGYVVVPPSVHPNGEAYEFMGERRKLQLWPSWLKPAENEPVRATESHQAYRPGVTGRGDRYAEAALAAEIESVRQANAGIRNDTLNRAAFALARFVASGDLPGADVAVALIGAATAAGLPELEARRTIASAFAARSAA